MKFRKKDIILKEEIAHPEAINVGNNITFKIKDGEGAESVTKKFIVVANDADNDVLTIKNEDGDVFDIVASDLKQNNANVTVLKNGKKQYVIKNVDADMVLPDNKEPADGCVIGSGTNQKLLNEYYKWIINGNDGDIVACYFIDEESGKITKNNISFEIVFKDDNKTFLRYNSYTGDIPYEADALKGLDSIYVTKDSFNTGEYCFHGVLNMVGEKNGTTDTFGFDNISAFGKTSRSAGGAMVDGFYNFMRDITTNSVMELEFDNDSNSAMYFEVLQPYGKEKAIFNLYNVKDVRPDNMSDPSAFDEKRKFTIGPDAVSSNNNRLTIGLVGGDGKKYIIKNVSDYMESNKTRREIEDVKDLSPEELKQELASNAAFRDSVIKKPNFFASLFGKENLGWIPIMQRADKEKYGDNFEELKRGQTIMFVFEDNVKPPLREGKNYAGKMEDKVTIRLNRIKLNNSEYENYKIKIINGLGDDVYEVEVYPTSYERIGIGNVTTTDGDMYETQIKIKNYNLS